MESERSNVQEVDYTNEEEDDGPPPGFQCIINNPNLVDFNKLEQPDNDIDEDQDQDEDDDPPPGFGPLSPKAHVLLLSSDKEKSGRLEDVEDDDVDDGPPPGWEFSSLAHALPKSSSITTDIKREEKEELNVDEEDDDGPPPGWEKVLPHQMPPPCVPQAQQSSNVSSYLQLRSKQDVAKNKDQEPQIVSEYNLIGQSSPPEPQVQQPQPSTILDTKRDEKEELNVDEEDNDGPPPGWENVLPHQMPPCVPLVQQSSKVTSDLQLGSKHDVAENNDKEPQIASQNNLIPEQSLPYKPSVQQPQPTSYHGGISFQHHRLIMQLSEVHALNFRNISVLDGAPSYLLFFVHGYQTSSTERGKGETRNRIKRPLTRNKSVSPVLPPPAPVVTASSTELAQLVCGACRKLCTYPRGAKWVQCPSCMEVNLAMEAHEIGQVKCNGCAMLLMYPYGSPAAQCSSCHTVTEIGAHNRRAPFSVQQNQRRRHPNRAR